MQFIISHDIPNGGMAQIVKYHDCSIFLYYQELSSQTQANNVDW